MGYLFPVANRETTKALMTEQTVNSAGIPGRLEHDPAAHRHCCFAAGSVPVSARRANPSDVPRLPGIAGTDTAVRLAARRGPRASPALSLRLAPWRLADPANQYG